MSQVSEKNTIGLGRFRMRANATCTALMGAENWLTLMRFPIAADTVKSVRMSVRREFDTTIDHWKDHPVTHN